LGKVERRGSNFFSSMDGEHEANINHKFLNKGRQRLKTLIDSPPFILISVMVQQSCISLPRLLLLLRDNCLCCTLVTHHFVHIVSFIGIILLLLIVLVAFSSLLLVFH
jgi:hypothetical protein